MNRQPLINLQKILTKLYEDERSIRRIVSDAGITSSTMYIDAHALNSWHSVLTEAEKHHQVETLLKAVENEFGNNQEFRAAYYAYRRSAISTSDTLLIRPFPVLIIGMLLIGIAAGSWYWGVFGLLKWGDAMLIAIPTVSRIEPTKTSTDIATAMLTQTTVLSLTSTPVLPNSTPTTPTILRSTAVATPMPTSISSYPCEAEVISSNGAQSVNTIRAKPSVTSPSRGALDVGTKVQVTQRDEDAIVWYRIMENGNSLGWIPAENLHLSAACPK